MLTWSLISGNTTQFLSTKYVFFSQIEVLLMDIDTWMDTVLILLSGLTRKVKDSSSNTTLRLIKVSSVSQTKNQWKCKWITHNLLKKISSLTLKTETSHLGLFTFKLCQKLKLKTTDLMSLISLKYGLIVIIPLSHSEKWP